MQVQCTDTFKFPLISYFYFSGFHELMSVPLCAREELHYFHVGVNNKIAVTGFKEQLCSASKVNTGILPVHTGYFSS